MDESTVGPCRLSTNQLQRLWLRTSCSVTSGHRCSPTEEYTYLKCSYQNRHSLMDETDSLLKVLHSFQQTKPGRLDCFDCFIFFGRLIFVLFLKPFHECFEVSLKFAHCLLFFFDGCLSF